MGSESWKRDSQIEEAIFFFFTKVQLRPSDFFPDLFSRCTMVGFVLGQSLDVLSYVYVSYRRMDLSLSGVETVRSLLDFAITWRIRI